MTAKAAALVEPEPWHSDGLPDVIHLPYDPAPDPVDNRAAQKAPRRFGKRKLADAREKFIGVRCNGSEYDAITAKASAAGHSTGTWLRILATGSAGPRAKRRPPPEREELARLLGEIGKLGSNVNQIAREVNTTGNLPATDHLAVLAAEVQVMRAALMKALGRGD